MKLPESITGFRAIGECKFIPQSLPEVARKVDALCPLVMIGIRDLRAMTGSQLEWQAELMLAEK